MKEENKFNLLFVLPFFNNVGDYVRGYCLKDFAPHDWNFIYIKGQYPKLFDIYFLRFFYRMFFYLIKIIIFSLNKKTVVYFLIPQNPILLFILKNIFRIKIIVDISDAQHLKQFLGYRKTLSIIKNSNCVVFEAQESLDFWKNKHNIPCFVCEDTPQHECIYIDYEKRNKKLIWIGSFHTADYLISFIDYFKLFNDKGYEIIFLGGTEKLSKKLYEAKIIHSCLRDYNLKKMIKELSSSQISFIPMENNDLFNFRGSLKAKVSMAYGCLVIASYNSAHKRLIKNNNNGFLFKEKKDLEIIIKNLEIKNISRNIALSGNVHVANKYTRKNHSTVLVNIANKILINKL